jgi:5-(carboxyamino)imidazole ribonucleotide synthase
MSYNTKKIGILGGGQLARMMCQRARQMGLIVHVLSSKKTDPAVTVCTEWHQGDLNKPADIKKFAKKVDLITFESEFIPAALLEKSLFEKSKIKKNLCFPQISNLAKIQDRWPQKELLWDHEIPSSPFMKINSKDDLDLAMIAYDSQFVLKQRFGGYDGFGTFIIKSVIQLNQFKLKFKGLENHFIAEEFIPFKSEMSLLFARNLKGQIYNYPLFTSVQKHNQCDQVFGPSTHPKQNLMIQKIQKMLTEINYVGLIAFELFNTGPDLIVNEIAPRVHNTGHITMDAFQIDQFEMHLRCVLNLDLPTSAENSSAKNYLMQNLSGSSQIKPLFLKSLSGRLHWYDKTELYRGRP